VPVPSTEGAPVWKQGAGVTVFAPFPESTEYWNAEKPWMINFRVNDLDRMVRQLRASGISVEVAPKDANGQFAHLHDPEGNPIELWQPAESG
jgi:predicted enzyme related to lactoylglutathione lyase